MTETKTLVAFLLLLLFSTSGRVYWIQNKIKCLTAVQNSWLVIILVYSQPAWGGAL